MRRHCLLPLASKGGLLSDAAHTCRLGHPSDPRPDPIDSESVEPERVCHRLRPPTSEGACRAMNKPGRARQKTHPKGDVCAACDGFLGASKAGFARSDTGFVLCARCAPPASRRGSAGASRPHRPIRRRVAQHEEAASAETAPAAGRAVSGASAPRALAAAARAPPLPRRDSARERRTSTTGRWPSRWPRPPTCPAAPRSSPSRPTTTSPRSRPCSRAAPTTRRGSGRARRRRPYGGRRRGGM